MYFLSYIREVVLETISHFIRIVRDFSINQYRCRLTFIEVMDINHILNTTCFSDVFTVFSEIFLKCSFLPALARETILFLTVLYVEYNSSFHIFCFDEFPYSLSRLLIEDLMPLVSIDNFLHFLL